MSRIELENVCSRIGEHARTDSPRRPIELNHSSTNQLMHPQSVGFVDWRPSEQHVRVLLRSRPVGDLREFDNTAAVGCESRPFDHKCLVTGENLGTRGNPCIGVTGELDEHLAAQSVGATYVTDLKQIRGRPFWRI